MFGRRGRQNELLALPSISFSDYFTRGNIRSLNECGEISRIPESL